MKRYAFLSIFMLLCTLVATVYAAPPVIEHFESDETFPLIDCGMVGVGDYMIYDHSVADITIKMFYDNDGNLLRYQGHLDGVDKLFAEGHPDRVVDGHFAGNWKTNFDPETGVPTINVSSGAYWNLQLPGYGNVFKIVGMEVKVYDPDHANAVDDWVVIKQAGLQTIDVAPICEYLLPPQ